MRPYQIPFCRLVIGLLAWCLSNSALADGHWRLDETSGTVAADSSGDAYHGTYRHSPTLGATGIFGKAVEFNLTSTDDRIDLPYTVLDGAMDVTVTFWLKTTRTGQACVLSGANAGSDNQFLVFFGSSTQLRLYKSQSQGDINIPSIADDQWHHFTVLWLGNHNLYVLFLDGRYAGHTFISGPTRVAVDIDPGGLMVGQEQDCVGGCFSSSQILQGSLDDLRVYRRALNIKEIAKLAGHVGQWALDDASGGTASDSSPAMNNGTVVGSQNWGTDCSGNGTFDFDGLGNYITVPNNTSVQLDESLSITAWVKSSEWGTGTDVDVILRKGEGGPNNYQLAVADGRLTLYLDDSDGSTSLQGNTQLETDRWYHLAATWDGNEVRLYVDGVMDHPSPFSHTAPISTDSRTLYLGGHTDGDRFDGMMRDVRLYSRRLFPSEIADLSTLTGYWNLDETSGTVAVDSTGHGNDGTYENGPILGEEGPIATAVLFDGVDDRVVVPVQPYFSSHTTTGITVSAWVKVLAVNTDGHHQTRQPIVSKGNSGYWEWALYVYDYGSAGFSTWQQSGSSHSEISGGVLPIGTWKHVAATFQDGVANRVYIDGVEVATGTSFSGDAYDGDRPVLIGAREDGQYLNAVIDDVRIYNRPLCPEEIQDIASGLPSGVRIIQWVEVR